MLGGLKGLNKTQRRNLCDPETVVLQCVGVGALAGAAAYIQPVMSSVLSITFLVTWLGDT